jgi:hypothetical protein
MASKKILSSDRTMQVLFNEYSDDDLIAGSNSNQSHDSERPKSPETAAISYVSNFIHGIVINNFLECFCDQINSHATQTIGAVPHRRQEEKLKVTSDARQQHRGQKRTVIPLHKMSIILNMASGNSINTEDILLVGVCIQTNT